MYSWVGGRKGNANLWNSLSKLWVLLVSSSFSFRNVFFFKILLVLLFFFFRFFLPHIRRALVQRCVPKRRGPHTLPVHTYNNHVSIKEFQSPQPLTTARVEAIEINFPQLPLSSTIDVGSNLGDFWPEITIYHRDYTATNSSQTIHTDDRSPSPHPTIIIHRYLDGIAIGLEKSFSFSLAHSDWFRPLASG